MLLERTRRNATPRGANLRGIPPTLPIRGDGVDLQPGSDIRLSILHDRQRGPVPRLRVHLLHDPLEGLRHRIRVYRLQHFRGGAVLLSVQSQEEQWEDDG